jgi:serine kinase of HPr protein (carbohydrate metabolism regulator)
VTATTRLNIHATGLVLGGYGLVLRGPSGSGKSLLALDLLEHWALRGEAAQLVADDRLDIESGPQGVVMHAPSTIAGLIELRGRGIVTRPFVAAAAIRLVVDLVEDLERMPEPAQFLTELMGFVLPRCPVPRRGIADSAHQRLLICQGLLELGAISFPPRQINT